MKILCLQEYLEVTTGDNAVQLSTANANGWDYNYALSPDAARELAANLECAADELEGKWADLEADTVVK